MTGSGQKAVAKETQENKKKRVIRIIRMLDKQYPDTTLALNFSTPLELLIALILAAQCTDERVNRVTARLFPKYRTPQDWVDLGLYTLEEEIRLINFYRNKAKSIHSCCRELISRFHGKVPDNLEDLVSLPGVGRKTANVLRGNAFDQPAIGVDRHVGRLAQRLGLTGETDPDRIEADLQPLVPDEEKVHFCRLLQAHGRIMCLARAPQCEICPVHDWCPFPDQPSSKSSTKAGKTIS